MGDGTEESHARAQAAVDHLMPYTEEFWTTSPAEGAAVAAKVAIDVWALRPAWDALVNDALAEATLTRPNFHGYVTEGKVGLLRAPELPARRDAGPGPRPPGRHLVKGRRP